MLWRELLPNIDAIVEQNLGAILRAQLANGAITASVKPFFNVYHNAYPRDASRVAIALDLFGQHDAARKMIDFFIQNQMENGEWSQCYDPRTGKIPLHFFMGLTEVDNQGLMIEAIFQHYQATQDRSWLETIFPHIEKGINYALTNFDPKIDLIWSSASIHEFPPWEAGFDIWPNCATISGLEKAAELARIIGRPALTFSWMDYAGRIKKSVLRRHWDGKLGYFLKRDRKVQYDLSAWPKIISQTRSSPYYFFYLLSYLQYYAFAFTYLRFKTRNLGERERFIDISAFSPAYFGVLPVDDPLMEKSVAAIEELLWDQKIGGILRYKEGIAPDPSGSNPLIQNGAGPWSTYTVWLARYYIQRGKAEKAKPYLDWILQKAVNRGLMCEHISRHTLQCTAEDFMWGRAELLITLKALQERIAQET